MNKLVGTALGTVLGFFAAEVLSRFVPEGNGRRLFEIGGAALGGGVGYLVAPYDAQGTPGSGTLGAIAAGSHS